MPTFAIVTTCKGRLHHLKQTLPLMAAQGPNEIIVVDYGCPDGTANWIEATFPDVTVVRLDDDPGFSASRARNAGARAAGCDWLCFVDADVLIAPGLLDWMRDHADSRHFYQVGKRHNQLSMLFGTITCPREAFERVGGFDEAFMGYGYEDSDLCDMLRQIGVTRAEYDRRFVSAIPHDDATRVRFHESDNKLKQYRLNIVYGAIKRHLTAQYGIDALSLEARKALMHQVRASLCDQDIHLKVQMPDFRVSAPLDGAAGESRHVELTIRHQRRYGFFGPRKWRIFKAGG